MKRQQSINKRPIFRYTCYNCNGASLKRSECCSKCGYVKNQCRVKQQANVADKDEKD